jgi:hypothetical protein
MNLAIRLPTSIAGAAAIVTAHEASPFLGKRCATLHATTESARPELPFARRAERSALSLRPEFGRDPGFSQADPTLPIGMPHLPQRLAEAARSQPAVDARTAQGIFIGGR